MFDYFNDDYYEETSRYYWEEIAEMKLGIHPSQVSERIKDYLHANNIKFNDITFLDWNVEGQRVKVSLDGEYYGIFNYDKNIFEKEED